ncbi:MarR family transcriptional regulator [Streptomyces sp. PTM05]|uniref:MarR family transcriptional regulator n=1 Tax=Streptantibioticus parmotrematis TaxID=2873249 RepID=A0ABS7QJF0_9ACTN|nr:MarR family transcriptional regulator [Streptantibioticus parmotrematis]MBY8883298.1 MarR family transcriptional regulator [Streptantibioticus parmotrematis]
MPDPADDATAALQQVLTAMSYLLTRPSAHDWLQAKAEVRVGRADVHLLLALAANGGICRVGDLAERLLVEPSHVTRQVAQLQEQGLVERSPDPVDRRARNISITPEGTSVLVRLRKAHQEKLCHALHDIDAADIDATVRVLGRLVERYALAVRGRDPYAALPRQPLGQST